jgi:hypothetical protein
MEKLSRRSDGAYETPSGLFAIAPRAVSGRRDGNAWFEFKATVLSPVTRVEWPERAPVIVIDQATARTMLLNGYAFGITDAQMDDYNAAVDAYNEANPADVDAAAREAEEKAAAEKAEAERIAAETPAPPPAPDAGVAAPEVPSPPPPPAPGEQETPAAPEPEAPKAAPKGKGK